MLSPRPGVPASRRLALGAVALALTIACSQPRVTPTPRPTLPVPTLGPIDQGAPIQPVDEASELEAAFAAEVEQATEQARFLAGAPCDRLTDAVRETPGMVGELRGYAATLRSLAARDRSLDRLPIQSRLQEMDAALAELDLALGACGLNS